MFMIFNESFIYTRSFFKKQSIRRFLLSSPSIPAAQAGDFEPAYRQSHSMAGQNQRKLRCEYECALQIPDFWHAKRGDIVK
jgi:hypothetical protein